MLHWLILALAALASSATAIDHNVFKNCSRVPFCARLRNNTLDADSQFSAVLENMTFVDDSILIPLINANDEVFTLIVDTSDSTARLRITEPDSTRFELPVGYSIQKEPKKIRFIHTISDDGKKATLRPDNIKPSLDYYIEFKRGPPFKVTFINAQAEDIFSFEGDRFLMENTQHSRAFTFTMSFNSEKLYGLFDHAWKLALTETVGANIDPYRLRNSDSWGYEADSPMALYGSHPVIYGHSAEYSSGIYLHNAAEQWIDINTIDTDTPSAYFMVAGGALDLFLLLGPGIENCVMQLTDLTGKAHLPQLLEHTHVGDYIITYRVFQLWTLGYHQCRFSYESQDDVKNVANLMVQNRFPMDAIWLDGDHTDDYRWFHWNHTTYTDPVDLQNNISLLNKVCVSISDPHIAVDDTYDVYIGGTGYFVQWENGTDYQADCWPGLSSWIDFFLPEAADYYSSWYSYDKFNGSTSTLAGIWNDMNEPAIFNEADDIEKSFPYNLFHRLDNNGTTVRHEEVHNIYGLMHTRATHKGLLIRDDYKKRPFILSRSTFQGSQTVAAMWTGDNSATWEHFANSITQCLTGNLVGMVSCGADIGGFIGDPSDELLQRWYQGAAWLPFFRGHSSKGTKRREPYLFSEDVQNVIRSAIELRYKHIWHIYTLFFLHAKGGLPVIAPLFYGYPGIHDRDTQISIGRDIMAVAVVNESVSSVEVLFPGTSEDIWYRIDDNSWSVYFSNSTQNVPVDITSSPVFYRGGCVVTRKDNVKLSTFDTIDDPFDLYVNLNVNGTAADHFYIDDYTSFDYDTDNTFIFFDLEWKADKNALYFEVNDGSWTDVEFAIGNIYVHYVQQNEETGQFESVQIHYNTTRDGRSLKSVNIWNEKVGDKSATTYAVYL